MKKELKSGILSADKSADCRPTVGGVNVIAVLLPFLSPCFFLFFFGGIVKKKNLSHENIDKVSHVDMCLRLILSVNSPINPDINSFFSRERKQTAVFIQRSRDISARSLCLLFQKSCTVSIQMICILDLR